MSKSRIEQLLEALCNGNTANIEPKSRVEAYLLALCKKGGGGGSGGGGSSEGYVHRKLIYELTTTEQVDTISFTFSEEQQAELKNAAGYMVFMKLNKANTITTADTNSGTVVVYLGNQFMKVNIDNASPTGNVSYISYAISGLYVDNTACTEFMENNRPREECFPVVVRTMVRQESLNSVVTTQNSRIANYFGGTFTIEPAYPIGSGSCVKVYAIGTTV